MVALITTGGEYVTWRDGDAPKRRTSHQSNVAVTGPYIPCFDNRGATLVRFNIDVEITRLCRASAGKRRDEGQEQDANHQVQKSSGI